VTKLKDFKSSQSNQNNDEAIKKEGELRCQYAKFLVDYFKNYKDAIDQMSSIPEYKGIIYYQQLGRFYEQQNEYA
jgi:hypothetical protein